MLRQSLIIIVFFIGSINAKPIALNNSTEGNSISNTIDSEENSIGPSQESQQNNNATDTDPVPATVSDADLSEEERTEKIKRNAFVRNFEC